jgi:hypothetical protein
MLAIKENLHLFDLEIIAACLMKAFWNEIGFRSGILAAVKQRSFLVLVSKVVMML